MKLIIIVLLSLSIYSCKTVTPKPEIPVIIEKTKIILPISEPPLVREVLMYSPTAPQAQYCVDSNGYKALLINVETLKLWGFSNYITIQEFNKSESTTDSTTSTVKTTK